MDGPENVVSAGVVAGVLAEPELARLRATGGAIVIAFPAPPRVVYANAAALLIFGADSLDDLTSQLFDPASAGSCGFAGAVRGLVPGGSARLQRRRFFHRRKAENVTFVCRIVAQAGTPLFIAAAQPTRPGAPRLAPEAGELIAAEWPASEPIVRSPVRFLWRTDSGNRLTAVTTELRQELGVELAGDLPTALGHLKVDPEALVAAALATRQTWHLRGLALHGPGTALTLELGGTPVLDPSRAFAGYRGFGVLQHGDGDEATMTANGLGGDAAPPSSISVASVGGADLCMPEPAPTAPTQDQIATAGEAVPATGAAGPTGLSPGERHAFHEIARVLGTPGDGEPGVPPATSPDAPPPDAPPPASTAEPAEPVGKDALLEHLPLALLVVRGNAALYLNRALLDLLGYADRGDFRDAGGLERMFHGQDPDDAIGAHAGAVAVFGRPESPIAVAVKLQAVDWEGGPATLISLRRTTADEGAAKVRALELELRTRDSDARELRAILDTATDGIAVLGAEGELLALNRSGEALFGYDQNEVAGQEFTMLLAAESHLVAAEYFQGLKSGGVASVLNDGREVVGRERQGGAIPLFMTIGRLPNAGAQKFCAVLRDLTPWKEAERELRDARRQAEQASQLKSDFLARVSHEIRTPLNAILGFAEVIVDERFGPIGNERYKDYLRDIHSSGSHVMSLVNDLLDLSKIEAGKMELTFSSVDVNRIVQECISLMQPEAARERIIIRTALAARLPNVTADERSVRQIVLNLLANAVKFNEPGGQVIVSSALTDAGQTLLRIRDTGGGMTEAEITMALEPFRQLATARTRSGTGLGLPLTKALVEANRASFSIHSRKQEGTLVEVAFPPARVLAE